MTVQAIRWFIDNNQVIYQVHPAFENGSNAPYDIDIAPDRVRQLTPVDDFGNLHNVVATFLLFNSFEELVKNNEDAFTSNEACFIDTDGVIFLISSIKENKSNAPYTIICEGDTVYECGEFVVDEGRPIENEYVLHTIPEFSKIMDAA